MQRNHAFDFMCGICILRMLTLHVAGFCGMRGDFWVEKMMAWSFFFMSFFFFKAGYFNRTVAGQSAPYVKDRTRRLLIPYLSWAIIGNIVYFGLMLLDTELFAQSFEDLRLDHLWTTSRARGNEPLWFLFSFYVAYLAMHFMQKVRGLRWIILTFPLVGYVLFRLGNPLWMSLDNVFLGIFFFFLGRVWRWLTDRLTAWHNSLPLARHLSGRSLVTLLSVLLLVGFVFSNRHLHGSYDMSLNHYDHSPFGAILNSALALCGLSGVLMALPQRRIPVLGYIGQHSMVYFVAHYPLLVACRLITRLAGETLDKWNDFILCSALILTACTLLVPIVEATPWLSGRYAKKPGTQPRPSAPQLSTAARPA